MCHGALFSNIEGHNEQIQSFSHRPTDGIRPPTLFWLYKLETLSCIIRTLNQVLCCFLAVLPSYRSFDNIIFFAIYSFHHLPTIIIASLCNPSYCRRRPSSQLLVHSSSPHPLTTYPTIFLVSPSSAHDIYYSHIDHSYFIYTL